MKKINRRYHDLHLLDPRSQGDEHGRPPGEDRGRADHAVKGSERRRLGIRTGDQTRGEEAPRYKTWFGWRRVDASAPAQPCDGARIAN